jgi:hypothetical protein
VPASPLSTWFPCSGLPFQKRASHLLPNPTSANGVIRSKNWFSKFPLSPKSPLSAPCYCLFLNIGPRSCLPSSQLHRSLEQFVIQIANFCKPPPFLFLNIAPCSHFLHSLSIACTRIIRCKNFFPNRCFSHTAPSCPSPADGEVDGLPDG